MNGIAPSSRISPQHAAEQAVLEFLYEANKQSLNQVLTLDLVKQLRGRFTHDDILSAVQALQDRAQVRMEFGHPYVNIEAPGINAVEAARAAAGEMPQTYASRFAHHTAHRNADCVQR